MFKARVVSGRRVRKRATATLLSSKLSKLMLALVTVVCILVSAAIAWPVYAVLMQSGPAGATFAQVLIRSAGSSSAPITSNFMRTQADLTRARVVIDRVIDHPQVATQIRERATPNTSDVASSKARAEQRAYVLNALKTNVSRDPAQLTFNIRAKDVTFAMQLSDAVAQSYADVIALGGPAQIDEILNAKFNDKAPPKNQFLIACAILLCIGLAVAVLVPLSMRSRSIRSKHRKFAGKSKGTSKVKNSKFEPYQEAIRAMQTPERAPKMFRDESIADKILATDRPEMILFVDAAANFEVPAEQHAQVIDHILATATDLIKAGKNPVIIDAAWAPDLQSSDMCGLSDLISGNANFGDILHCDPETGISYVPRGAGPLQMHMMTEIIDLRDAMASLFDIVLVHIGDVQAASLLTTFASASAQIVIVEPGAEIESGRKQSWTHTEQKFEEDIWLEAGFAAVHIIVDPAAATRRDQHAQRQQLTKLQRRERMIKPAGRSNPNQKRASNG